MAKIRLVTVRMINCPCLNGLVTDILAVLGVIENYSRMPAKFKVETRNLFEKYYPIEIDPHLSVEEKLPHMIQWYDKAHDLMLQCDLYKKDFTLMTEETPLKFR